MALLCWSMKLYIDEYIGLLDVYLNETIVTVDWESWGDCNGLLVNVMGFYNYVR
ncbi:32959_t:CDS:1, partial [Racocetra persica]